MSAFQMFEWAPKKVDTLVEVREAPLLCEALANALRAIGTLPVDFSNFFSNKAIDWEEEVRLSSAWPGALRAALECSWAAVAELHAPLLTALGEAGARALVGGCFLDALEVFHDLETPNSARPLQADEWGKKYAAAVAARLRASYRAGRPSPRVEDVFCAAARAAGADVARLVAPLAHPLLGF